MRSALAGATIQETEKYAFCTEGVLDRSSCRQISGHTGPVGGIGPGQVERTPDCWQLAERSTSVLLLGPPCSHRMAHCG